MHHADATAAADVQPAQMAAAAAASTATTATTTDVVDGKATPVRDFMWWALQPLGYRDMVPMSGYADRRRRYIQSVQRCEARRRLAIALSQYEAESAAGTSATGVAERKAEPVRGEGMDGLIFDDALVTKSLHLNVHFEGLLRDQRSEQTARARVRHVAVHLCDWWSHVAAATAYAFVARGCRWAAAAPHALTALYAHIKGRGELDPVNEPWPRDLTTMYCVARLHLRTTDGAYVEELSH